MKAIISSINEEFEKSRSLGAKDKRPRKRTSFDPNKALGDRTKGLHRYSLGELISMRDEAGKLLDKHKRSGFKHVVSHYSRVYGEISNEISKRGKKSK